MAYSYTRQFPALGSFGYGLSYPGQLHHQHAGSAFVGEASSTPQPPEPVFRFSGCSSGCAPFTATECRNILRQAILDAISLAANAASKLEANPVDAATDSQFLFLYGHHPTRPVPWANNRPSGSIVALRFRIVARELQSRRVLFQCGCPGARPSVNARTLRPYTLNTIRLCPRFWRQSRMWRAGIILHEMLHLYFGEFFRHHPHGEERRRDNAHCYEAFALQASGHAPDGADIRSCRSRPA